MTRVPLFADMLWSIVDDQANSGNLAISANGESVTYRELGARVAGRARTFAANVPPTGRIALLQERTVDLCVDILAGLCSGVSVSILSRTDAVDLSQAKLRSIGAHMVITDFACQAFAQQIVAQTGIDAVLRSDLPADEMTCVRPEVPNETDEALVIFTSGSTSTPKGVALSQMNIAVNTQSLTRVIPVTPADHLLQVMPLSHTNGLLNQILLPLSMGARVTLLSHFEPRMFLDAMAETRPSFFTGVPTMLTRLLDYDVPPAAVENLRFIRSGAAPLLPHAHRRVEAHFGCDVIVSYGQTETTCTNTANPPLARRIGSVGQMLKGREIAILAPDADVPVDAGQSGEVCFRGPCIAMGFVGEPPFDSTAWFRTGDFGFLDGDGYLFLTGRLKDIIIRGGANLSPRQIEDCLLGHDDVGSASVFPVPHADLGEVPVAAIVPAGRNPVKLRDLNQRIAEKLSPSHKLNSLYEYARLPVNDVGKVDVRRLKEECNALEERRKVSGLTVRCDDDAPLHYIQRTRHYYQTLGFGTPYDWAHNVEIPFCRMKTGLKDATVAIVTTAAPFKPGAGDQGPGAPYNAGAKFYAVYSGLTTRMPDLRIAHIAIDRDNTRADDIDAYFPLAALKAAAASGRIGRVAPRFFGLPTNRSKQATQAVDAQDLLKRCMGDQVDAVIFVPNCPVCHQSVTLAARVIERAGISTVVMGCASDIVQSAGAPRFVFSDFPLGNSAGRPYDKESQQIILNAALDTLENATESGTVVQSPLKWVGRENWKNFYSNPDLLSPEEIAERRAKFDEAKSVARALRENNAK